MRWIAIGVFFQLLYVGVTRADEAAYRPKKRDPLLEKLRSRQKKARQQAERETSQIDAKHKKRKEKLRRDKRSLLFSMKGISIPPGRKVFQTAFHFPPVPQYRTGTCWAFSSTSYFESEVKRLTGRTIKLSEMYTVYYEYLEKVRRYVRQRGHSKLGQGSENNATVRIIRRYGAVPREAYRGDTSPGRPFDHTQLMRELKAYLAHIKSAGFWDEDKVLAYVRVLLDRRLGPPPSRFRFEGRSYTPRSFVDKILKLRIDDYIELMSTKSKPFWKRAKLEVPDNWWHSREYHNVPLDVFYRLIKTSIRKGYTVAIGGDVSEPGKNPFKDSAVIPDYDLPQSHIDQDSREYRIANGSTTDDHGVHLVGYVRHKNHDWFLIKDSGRSARWGRDKGYYYFREDFIRLKMLSCTIHKDILGPLLARFGRRKAPPTSRSPRRSRP